MVDMEGISGIINNSFVLKDSENYNLGCRYMLEDTNACIEGCFAGGASEVIVRDCHGTGQNMCWADIDSRVKLIQGPFGKERMPDIATCDGLVLLGYHAMAGTPEAILEHTWSSKEWQNFYINGTKSGEIALDAALAGEFDVPVIMVSGDDKTCSEAQSHLGDQTVVATVKDGLHCFGARMLSMKNANDLIRDLASKAVKKLKANSFNPFKPSMPITFKLELTERTQLPRRSYIKHIDGRTFSVQGSSVEEAFVRLVR